MGPYRNWYDQWNQPTQTTATTHVSGLVTTLRLPATQHCHTFAEAMMVAQRVGQTPSTRSRVNVQRAPEGGWIIAWRYEPVLMNGAA